MTILRRDEEAHHDVCEKEDIPCNSCGLIIKRDMQGKHECISELNKVIDNMNNN